MTQTKARIIRLAVVAFIFVPLTAVVTMPVWYSQHVAPARLCNVRAGHSFDEVRERCGEPTQQQTLKVGEQDRIVWSYWSAAGRGSPARGTKIIAFHDGRVVDIFGSYSSSGGSR